MIKTVSLLPVRVLPPSPMDMRIAFISSYPPRRCGIGTFTKDLASAINNLNSDRLAEIIAMDDALSESLEYPWEVSHRIRQESWEDYEKVLTYLNNSVIHIVSIQHEYGIFGGDKGSYIVDFARKLKIPYVVTLHTIKQEPQAEERRILQDLCAGASAVVVMLSVAVDILRDTYGIPSEKVVTIHHGAPDFPFSDEGEVKELLGYGERIIMSSVNLISKWKSLEYAIAALPSVVKKYPNFLYLIVGQTHPVVLEREGEKYRTELEQRVKELKLVKHVKFINEYVSLDDLIDYVRASDFYITPYEGLEQISSGSLAYAIAAGKLCISTPYLYAAEMLAGGRGFLVPPKDPKAITQAILHALKHRHDAELVQRKCYAQGRKMTWARVAFRYVHMMDRLVNVESKSVFYPQPTLSYLRFMTDKYGLLEHSLGDERDPKEGYAVDDNARGLIVAIRYGDKKLASKYLDFLESAVKDGKMYCDMDHEGQWLEKPKAGPWTQPGTADWFGRTFWALGYTMRYASTLSLRNRATNLLKKILPQAGQASTIHTWTYILLGLASLKKLEWDECQEDREALLTRAVKIMGKGFRTHNDESWHWVEDRLHYDNARIPHALLEIADAYTRHDLKDLGLQLLNFLLDETFNVLQNHFCFIGSNGWYPKDGSKAKFDEQPIEAGATVQACYAAYKATGHGYYRDMAYKAFAWFHGDNILRRPLYNEKRESVYDGIRSDGLNMNQGAECILEYLLAYSCYAKLIEEGMSEHDLTYTSAPNRTIAQTTRP